MLCHNRVQLIEECKKKNKIKKVLINIISINNQKQKNNIQFPKIQICFYNKYLVYQIFKQLVLYMIHNKIV